MLKMEHIEKTFGHGSVNESTLFTDFNLHVKPGEFLSVVGSNGSGKTTMLNIISGTIPSDKGTITLGGRDITKLPEHRRASRIGRVFQDPSFGTVPSMSIIENLALAENKKKPYSLGFMLDSRRRSDLRQKLSLLGLGLEDKADVPVGLLSGGQRQALSLLMSTMTDIDLLLLDEHTAALDPKTAENIMILTDKIVRESHLTAVMVTHNLRYAVEYGSRMIMMHEGQIILDRAGDEKESTQVDDILGIFNNISIECGN